MSVDHYENFPVASILLPHALRGPVAAIYHFARNADDFADEGALNATERLTKLAAYRAELDAITAQRPTSHPVFLALRPVISRYNLPLNLFYDLLDAFTQDVRQDRYADYPELLDYCRRSANPVGRLMLHLFSAVSAENLRQSDAICTALQLINHWQDVGIDLTKGPRGRIYLPQDDLARFGLADADLGRRTTKSFFAALMALQCTRARALMDEGAPLGWRVPGRMGLEIRAIVAGGLRILDKLDACGYDVFTHRPTLTPGDWPRLVWRALVRPLV